MKKMEELITILQKAPLFKGVEPEKMFELLGQSNYQIKRYEKGRLIFQSGDPVDKLIVLIKGKISAEMLDPSGKSLKIEDAEAPQSLATAFMYGQKQKIPVNVTAIKDSEFMYIQKDQFQKMLIQSEKLLTNYINMISTRAQFLSDKVKFMSFNTIRQKLAHFLLDRMDAEKEPFNAGMSQTAMAELFGVARPSLARCIGELEDEGVIYCERSFFTVFDIQVLKDELMDM
ncbi:MAG: Crp/Fnr family transcriptional regulator [Salinivirgaceae bacterium]|nr:MAG: Crp/Fnr family transcriptional regulator [Salinivirgaceae bacterium]